MPTESFYYQELREMLQKPGCPVCHVGRKVARGQIELAALRQRYRQGQPGEASRVAGLLQSA